jgi:hypothetical protein
MSVFDRVGKVVKAEWGHRFGRQTEEARDRSKGRGRPSVAATTARRPMVADVEGARRVLELTGEPTLAEVRARYQELARRYHPKTGSERADEAQAARVVLEALTDALEILEEQLLPLPR